MLSDFRKNLGLLKRDKFFGAAAVLVSGTGFAQLLGIIALPVLTRFYTPDDFSILAMYVAILTIFSAVMCMRLDAAIPLPEEDDEADLLLALSLFCIVVFVGLTTLIIFFWGPLVATLIGRPAIGEYLWLLPLGLGLMGTYSAFQYLAIRQKAFSLIAKTKVNQAALGLGAQIGLGWFGVAPLGLLLGHVVLSGAGVFTLALNTLRSRGLVGSLLNTTWSRISATLIAFRRFPQFSVADQLTNNAGMQLPILIIASFLAGPEVGLLFLAMRAGGAPLAIIGSAVAQVYYANAPQYARMGSLAEETERLVRRLSRMLVVPMLVLGPFAPSLFEIIFGPEWAAAGTFFVYMLPWYSFRLTSSPISMVMHVCGKQKLMLILTLFGLLLRTIPLIFVLSYAPFYGIIVLAGASAVYYFLLLIIFMSVSGLASSSVIKFVCNEVGIWLIAAVVGFSLNLMVASLSQ